MSKERKNLSIGALAKVTGVPVNTLRTWESRYGFPSSTRLPSGHRRYGEEQVQHVQWASQAIKLGHKPSTLESLSTNALQMLVKKEHIQAVEPLTRAPANHIKKWLSHVDNLNMAALEKDLYYGCRLHGAVGLFDQLLKPFLFELGRGWQAGRFTVAQEHAASECVSNFISVKWPRVVTECDGARVVLATLPDQQHILGLQQVAVVLSMHGYRVSFIGRGAPVPALLEAVTQLQPTALMISVPISRSEHTKNAQLRELRTQIDDSIQIVLGGSGAPTNIPGILTLSSTAQLNDWAIQNSAPQERHDSESQTLVW